MHNKSGRKQLRALPFLREGGVVATTTCVYTSTTFFVVLSLSIERCPLKFYKTQSISSQKISSSSVHCSLPIIRLKKCVPSSLLPKRLMLM